MDDSKSNIIFQEKKAICFVSKNTLFASDGVSPTGGTSVDPPVNNSSVSADGVGALVVVVLVAAAVAAAAVVRYLIAICFN